MEIINLFILTIVFYILSCIEFYVKTFLFFCLSMFISMLLNYKFFEEKSKETDIIKYKVGDKVIKFTFMCYEKSIIYIDKAITLPVIRDIYKYLEGVNKHYVLGRNKLISSTGSFLYKTFLPKFELSSLLSGPVIEEEKPVKKITNTFKSESDMNEFLNELLKKDK